jgi:hypothetical protein
MINNTTVFVMCKFNHIRPTQKHHVCPRSLSKGDALTMQWCSVFLHQLRSAAPTCSTIKDPLRPMQRTKLAL